MRRGAALVSRVESAFVVGSYLVLGGLALLDRVDLPQVFVAFWCETVGLLGLMAYRAGRNGNGHLVGMSLFFVFVCLFHLVFLVKLWSGPADLRTLAPIVAVAGIVFVAHAVSTRVHGPEAVHRTIGRVVTMHMTLGIGSFLAGLIELPQIAVLPFIAFRLILELAGDRIPSLYFGNPRWSGFLSVTFEPKPETPAAEPGQQDSVGPAEQGRAKRD